MSDSNDEVSIYQVANRFIELANELAKNDDSGTVGAALRYAAARYNAFEASLDHDDLAAGKERVLDMFSRDYRLMLEENVDDYIALSKKS